jgi:hypothetical protein
MLGTARFPRGKNRYLGNGDMPELTHAEKIRRNALRVADRHTDAFIGNAEQLAGDLTNLETLKKRILDLSDACSNLDKALKNHLSLDERKLRLAVERVRSLESDWAFMSGIQEGFRIAQQQFQKQPKMERKLKKARGQWRALRVIVRILHEDPNQPTSQIFKKMDKRKVPVFAYGGIFPGPGFRRWSDVSKEQVFKNLVAKARKAVRLNLRSNRWEQLLRPPKIRKKERPSTIGSASQIGQRTK